MDGARAVGVSKRTQKQVLRFLRPEPAKLAEDPGSRNDTNKRRLIYTLSLPCKRRGGGRKTGCPAAQNQGHAAVSGAREVKVFHPA